MICWVIYDIEDDKARQQVAKYCKQAGLYRVQLSVFLGELENTQKDTLRLQLETLINHNRDKVYLFPMTKLELQQTILLGQAFDKKLVTSQIKAFFL